MSVKPDLRHYADWYRSLARTDRRNGLDDLADKDEVLRHEVDTLRQEWAGLLVHRP